MNLSQLLSDNNNITIKDDYFISKGNFLLQSCYAVNVHLDLNYFSEITSDADQVFGLLFELDNRYYLCTDTGSDGYRDYRSDIFEIKPKKLSELKKYLQEHQEYVNLVSTPMEVSAKFDFVKEEDLEGLAFFITNFSEETPILRLSCFCYDEYYPHSSIAFDTEVYQKAFPIIEKQQLEKQIDVSHQKNNIQKI
jgi:hypothetical protein